MQGRSCGLPPRPAPSFLCPARSRLCAAGAGVGPRAPRGVPACGVSGVSVRSCSTICPKGGRRPVGQGNASKLLVPRYGAAVAFRLVLATRKASGLPSVAGVLPAGVDLLKLSARLRSAARAALCCRCCGIVQGVGPLAGRLALDACRHAERCGSSVLPVSICNAVGPASFFWPAPALPCLSARPRSILSRAGWAWARAFLLFAQPP